MLVYVTKIENSLHLKKLPLGDEKIQLEWKLNVNPLKTKRRLLYLNTQFVPRSKHFSSRL